MTSHDANLTEKLARMDRRDPVHLRAVEGCGGEGVTSRPSGGRATSRTASPTASA